MLKSYFTKDLIEAGCDEAGRGCLAGPVVAAAVVLPKDFTHSLLNDSKQLSKNERLELKKVIQKEAIAYAVAEVCNREIEKINILNASFLAMNKAVAQLHLKPELLLIDGNRFKPAHPIPYECIVKGDSLYLSIAAASVLAKTYRDELMEKLAAEYPYYGWETNVGYPTPAHREGIMKHGVSPYHRMTFQLLPDQLELFD